jgi:hypothetical protein
MRTPSASFVLLFGLALLSGCDQFGTSPAPSFDGPLLPLAPGYEWTLVSAYTDSTAPDTTHIRALNTVEVDGRTYVALEGLHGDNAVLLREGKNGHVYRREDETEQLWLDPSVDGDSTYTYRTFNVRVSTVPSLHTPAGRFQDCIRFAFNIPNAVDDGRSITIKPGVGFVERWGAWIGAWRLAAVTTEKAS